MTRSPYLSPLLALLLLASGLTGQEGSPSPQEIEEMMKKAKEYTTPGAEHELLERFLGRWTTETRLLSGERKGPVEKGTLEGKWLMKDRWLEMRGEGRMMGRALKSFSLLGYDKFKKSYVVTMVNDLDTAMLRAEGDATRTEDALIVYGTLDEYLTGEHDKMVKYVWRFVSPKEILFEVHDLPIGETGAQVIEMRMRRVE